LRVSVKSGIGKERLGKLGKVERFLFKVEAPSSKCLKHLPGQSKSETDIFIINRSEEIQWPIAEPDQGSCSCATDTGISALQFSDHRSRSSNQPGSEKSETIAPTMIDSQCKTTRIADPWQRARSSDDDPQSPTYTKYRLFIAELCVKHSPLSPSGQTHLVSCVVGRQRERENILALVGAAAIKIQGTSE